MSRFATVLADGGAPRSGRARKRAVIASGAVLGERATARAVIVPLAVVAAWLLAGCGSSGSPASATSGAAKVSYDAEAELSPPAAAPPL